MTVRSIFPPTSFYGIKSNQWYIICTGGDGWVAVDRQYSRAELDSMWDKISYGSVATKVTAPYKQYEVQGSKGAVYKVTHDSGFWSCNCPAYSYGRGKDCKHITNLKNTLA